MADGQDIVNLSDTLGEILSSSGKIADDLAELFLVETEVENAREGAANLLANLTAIRGLITTNTGNITTNTNSISSLTTEVTNAREGAANLLANLTAIRGLITTNASNISTNASGISTNAANIATNTSNISSVTTEVTNARDGKATLLDQINELQALIDALEAQYDAIVSISGCLVSLNDTTVGVLNGKLVAGQSIDFTENNDGGNETLTIASTAPDSQVNRLTNSGFRVNSQSTPEVSGSDLVTNGGFETDASGWTANNGATLTGGQSSGQSGNCLALSGDGATSNPSGYQSITCTVGHLYKATGYFINNTETGALVYLTVGTSTGGSQTGIDSTTTTGSWQQLEVWFVATQTTHYIGVQKASSGTNSIKVDTVTCTEIVPGYVAADGNAPDGWDKSSTALDLLVVPDEIKEGCQYSLKFIPGAAGDQVLWPKDPKRTALDHRKRFAGQTVAVGVWAKTSTANHVKLFYSDGSVAFSDAHTGSGNWEWLEFSFTVADDPTTFYIGLFGGQSSGDIYFCQPMLIFGSYIGEGNYVEPRETINCDAPIRLFNNTSPLAADDKTYDVQELSEGKLLQGLNSIDVSTQLLNSVVGSDQGLQIGPSSGYFYQLRNLPQINNIRNTAHGSITLQDGAFWQTNTTSGDTLSGYFMDVFSVEI